MAELEQELRREQAAFDSDHQLLQMLRAAQEDPNRLIATPNRLLEALPALRRLKEGLIDAQLRMAKLQGTMSNRHPLVVAAVVAQQEIRTQLHRELGAAIRGLEAEQRLAQQRIDSLSKQLDAVRQRMDRLARLRAQYSNLIAESDRCAESLRAAEQSLAAAMASRSSIQATSLLARMGQPQCSANPVGPGRAVIALAGCVAGLLIGLGIVLLTAVPAPASDIRSMEASRPPAQTAEAAAPRVQAGDVAPLAASPAASTVAGKRKRSVASGSPAGPLTLTEALARCADSRRLN